MLKALIFDFDGLILDTETPDYIAWQDLYQQHGFELPHHEWGKIVGGSGLSKFNPADHLSHLSQGRLDSGSLRAQHTAVSLARIHAQPILPGVSEMIRAAQAHGLKLAIASSSTHAWVDNHAKRLNLFHHFDRVVCSDDVGSGRVKPNPDLFLLALNQLQVRRDEAVVFEDSPNGVKAAHQAGIFVVAVPNPVTSQLTFEEADLTVKSLADLSLSALMNKVQ